MAWLGLGVFYTGAIVGIPVVTGVAQGVQQQKQANADAANQDRMIKFYMDVFCAADSKFKDEVHGTMIVLKHDKVWLAPKDPETLLPLPLKDAPAPHAFAGFYIQYPDDDRSPAQLGMVSTISVDPPMLNWIYVDKNTFELRYGNRSQSIEHLVGPWDWTEDEVGVTLDGWEGFVVVEEEEKEDGLKWALYYDQWDDDFGNGRKVGGRNRLQCSLERRVLPDELRKAQELAAEKKMQVKSSGDLKTQWG
ncbi:hypothetical protein BT63DRAFT_414600 [Microthyrium microscopicum]|uniref:Uncharacterized protein n=1 Tax=Microthyrium microscopicum TaxID=703497 RepID=A0A6A6UAZ7_9PEZI|nr:hypothetical protein BT63DRAFT_414600 [Microthyrium microscopicum]